METCPNSPVYGKAFCQHHCEAAPTNGILTELKGYLAYKGNPYGNCIMIKSPSFNTLTSMQGVVTARGGSESTAAECQGL